MATTAATPVRPRRRPAAVRAGIDLGGTKIQVVIVDAKHQVLGQARGQTPTTGGPEGVAAVMAETLREAAAVAGIETSKLRGVGVGSPGAIDSDTGTVSGAGNLPGWAGSFALGPELAAAVGAPVALGNDVQVATDAEFALGVGREFDSLLGVFWGTGVGGGLVLDGKPWLGRGSAGEIGHVVIRRNGRRCPCGRRGCMEAYAGRSAMERRARRLVKRGTKTSLFSLMEERGRDRLTSGVWGRALEKGDALATSLIDDAVDALGVGVGSVVNVLDVGAVVIGGGLGVRFGAPMAQRIADAMQPHLFVSDHPPVVEVAALGDLGGAIGAALLVPTRARSRTR